MKNSCIITVIFAFSFIFQACHLLKNEDTEEQIITEERLDLKITNLYYQEIIPGEQDSKIQHGFWFTVLNSEVTIDSVVHKGGQALVKKKENRYHCLLQHQLNQKDYKVSIYYLLNKTTYKKEITHTEVKAPIYMP